MSMSTNQRVVVVGIDGSHAALRAALWAVDEAAALDVPVRLVHVVDPQVDADDEHGLSSAHDVLHRAWETVTAGSSTVKVETEIRHGAAATELIAAAHGAAMLCVGAKGQHDSPRDHRGQVARTAAALADTSVAIVRAVFPPDGDATKRWIVAILDETPQAASAFTAAIEHAKKRNRPVLALTPWSTSEHHHHQKPDGDLRKTLMEYLVAADEDDEDLQVCSIQTPHDLPAMLEDIANTLDMVIAGDGDPALLHRLTGIEIHRALRGSHCTLLIARD